MGARKCKHNRYIDDSLSCQKISKPLGYIAIGFIVLLFAVLCWKLKDIKPPCGERSSMASSLGVDCKAVVQPAKAKPPVIINIEAVEHDASS